MGPLPLDASGKHMSDEAREEWVREQVPSTFIWHILINFSPLVFTLGKPIGAIFSERDCLSKSENIFKSTVSSSFKYAEHTEAYKIHDVLLKHTQSKRRGHLYESPSSRSKSKGFLD